MHRLFFTQYVGVYLMSKGYGPRFGHNQYENEQFKSAMRELGFNRTFPQWEKAHREVMKYKKRVNILINTEIYWNI